MEIAHLTESIIEYLSISSALLLILGLLSLFAVRSMKTQGRTKLWVCTLIVIMPLAYPLKSIFPESVRIPVHMELKYLQPHNETASEKTIAENTASFSDNGNTVERYKNNEAVSFKSEASSSGIKDPFIATAYGLTENWRLIAATVWVGVFFFFLIRLAATGYKTNKILRLAAPFKDPDILNILHRCTADTGLRRTPGLFVAEGISTPMVMGFFKPGILIPRHLLRPELREGLRFTLLHELKHLQQHHNWWLLIESIIGSAYFFHPVFHWAKRKIHEELEHICDSHVIHVTDKSFSYADFLLTQIWQQNSGRNPALALPFVTTVSKTAARIHSILENTVPAPFMQIRDRLSVFFILIAFPSILLLSIAPSAQDPDQALNMLNPVKMNIQETADHTNEPSGQKKDVIIEKSATVPSNEKTSHIEKPEPLLKTADTVTAPSSVFREETSFVTSPESARPPIDSNDDELSAETIEEKPLPETLQSLNASDTFTGNNMLWAEHAPDTGESADKSTAPIKIAEKYLGSPVNELSITRIDNIKILDEYTVLFMMRGGDIYLTRLSDPCPVLMQASDFNLVSTNGRLSKFDRIQAISNNQAVGISGMLSSFHPYRYEGNKYEAIKLLKKSILTELVSEGAFNEFGPEKG